MGPGKGSSNLHEEATDELDGRRLITRKVGPAERPQAKGTRTLSCTNEQDGQQDTTKTFFGPH